MSTALTLYFKAFALLARYIAWADRRMAWFDK